MLVASDLTGRSVYPLQRAVQLKAESDCQMTVLHVVEHGLTQHVQERRRAEAARELESWKQALPEPAQLGIGISVAVGDPFAEIVDVLQSGRVDLAVVGGPGKRGLRELFIGTTAERVIRFSDQPVLMVNRHPNGHYKRVVVAIDFSHAALRALEWACRIAPQAEIKLVHAWQTPLWEGSIKGETDAANERLRTQEHRQLNELVTRVAGGRTFPLEIVEDDPFTALRNAIGLFNADLLAMGTHARTRLATAMIGSLAEEFLAAGACDVLVTKA
jgi:nucleotide-binding universal stress UspA family protein